QPLSALVPAPVEAVRRRGGVAAAGLRLLARCLFLGDRAAALRLPHRAAGADPLGLDAGLARALHLLDHSPTGELRGRDELRDLPDVLRVLRALPAVAHPRVERAAV